jgi:hypothetical protein
LYLTIQFVEKRITVLDKLVGKQWPISQNAVKFLNRLKFCSATSVSRSFNSFNSFSSFNSFNSTSLIVSKGKLLHILVVCDLASRYDGLSLFQLNSVNGGGKG